MGSVVYSINISRLTISAHKFRSCLGVIGTRIHCRIHRNRDSLRFDYVMPVNDVIKRTQFPESSFNLTEESFDFPISLGVFYPINDMLDLMLVKKIFELVLGMFPVLG